MRSKTDSEIEQRVLKELRLSDKVGSAEICVFASNGVVELRGSVTGHKNKSAAEVAAYRADDIRGVINEIRIKPRTTRIERGFVGDNPRGRFAWAEVTESRRPVVKGASA
jgi:hypothetical protein